MYQNNSDDDNKSQEKKKKQEQEILGITLFLYNNWKAFSRCFFPLSSIILDGDHLGLINLDPARNPRNNMSLTGRIWVVGYFMTFCFSSLQGHIGHYIQRNWIADGSAWLFVHSCRFRRLNSRRNSWRNSSSWERQNLRLPSVRTLGYNISLTKREISRCHPWSTRVKTTVQLI